jgi:hypothetical protein
MTDIVDVARRVQYTGNGTAGPFSFSFQVNAQTEIKVFVGTTQKTLTTHYTVSLTSSGAGSVTFTSGNFPTSSETITIVSAVGLARSSVYTTGGPLTATALEADFDTNIMILQQSSQKVDRALAAPEFDSTSIDMTLPAVDSRKGKILGFNATTGNPEVVGETATVTTIFNAIGDNTLTLTGTITYGSLSDGTITITAFVDEDDMSSNSATLVPTQQSVKAYVDSQVTAQDLDATTDSGTIAIDLDSETLTIAGGEGIDTSATGNTITIAGEDASTSNKGVASFASADFDVSSGAVSIKSGGVSNDQLAGSIADSKLSTITTADKVSGAAVQIDGATDGTSITVADSDKLLIDDGGTTKYINASQLNSYISAEALAMAADNLSAGDAAVTLTTTSGNITIDAQANNSDIIFKGTDATVDTTFLTISGADAGAATFNSDVKSASGNFVTTGSNIALKHSSGENFFTATKDQGSAIYHDTYPVFSTAATNAGAVGTTNRNTQTLDTQSTFLEIGNSGIAGGTDTGTVVLSATSNANDERIGDIRFANAANADDDGTDADGRMVARIQTKSVTSDSNAGDDSGGTIVFSTKPEAGSIATALTLGSDQSATFGGSVAIGTSGANYDVQVHQSDSTNSIIQFTNSTTGTTSNDGLLVGINSSEQAQVFNRENTDLLFATNNSERMRIDSSGNVGIGTSSPSDDLHIASSVATIRLEDNDIANGEAYSKIFTHSHGGIEFSADPDGNRSSTDIRFTVDGSERMRIDSSGNVGIGTTTIARELELWNSDSTTYSSTTRADAGTNQRILNYSNTTSVYSGLTLAANNGGSTTSEFTIANVSTSDNYKGQLVFQTRTGASSYAERMRLDSSGNLLVGKTSSATNTVGIEIDGANGVGVFTRDGNAAIEVNRKTSNGTIINLRKDGSSIGSIGVNTSDYPFIANPASGGAGIAMGAGTAVIPTDNTGQHSDNTKDVGASSVRFDDVFATNGTIQTSDENEKQDIALMTTEELAVGKRLSTLFKTFRWKDKVTEKADKARTHSGIIAQEVKAAFEAEGLDATKYALFCSDTWTNDDGDEQTRMGVRYPELLSFIASYNESRFTAIEARLAKLEGG